MVHVLVTKAKKHLEQGMAANIICPVADIFVDSVHIELSLWDTAGQEEFDRLRSLSYGQFGPPPSPRLGADAHRLGEATNQPESCHCQALHPESCTQRLTPTAIDDTDLIMLCYSVDSKDSLENVESKWVGEIADNCPGVKLVLVALKCDLREAGDEDEDGANDANPGAANGVGGPREKKPMINYDQGLEVARRINAMRYLECSAMRNRGVNEAFTEAARVALSVKKEREDSKCCVM